MLCCGKQPGGEFDCEVVLLSGSTLSFRGNIHFKRGDKTLKIFDAVCNHLELTERDYFGLRYNDGELRTHWLDLYKKFRDHEGLDMSESVHQFQFGVRFYVSDPVGIHDKVARHQFFLQLKIDLTTGKLPCESRKSIDIAALGTQVDLGDYKKDFHRSGYLREVQFIPDQDKSFSNEVERLHARYNGLSSENAEQMYLRKCRQLDMYGLETHPVKDEFGHDCVIGLSYKGIEVRKNSRKLKTHYWQLVSHIEFKDKQVRLQVRSRNCNESVYTFSTMDRLSCKRLWKRAIEHHEFFRLRSDLNTSHNPSSKTASESWSRKQETLIASGATEAFQRKTIEADSRSNHTVFDTPIDVTPRRTVHENASENEGQNILDQRGLFGIEGNRNSSRMYITPKSVRRERNRHLRSLSDSENKHNRVKSGTGKSSGEESDGYSLHKSRNKHRRSREYRTKTNGRPNAYHTDTEAIKRSNIDASMARKRSETESLFQDERSRKLRKAQNRLSREDVRAQRALWQHIKKQNEDFAEYSPEQLQDIPYTEVKTDGNPLPVYVRKHGRGAPSPRSRRSRSSVTKESLAGDYMVPSLPVTTANDRSSDKHSTKKLPKASSKSSLNRYAVDGNSQQIWDTRNTKRTKS